MTGMSGLPPSMSAYALNTPGPNTNMTLPTMWMIRYRTRNEPGDANQQLRTDRRIEDAQSR